ncbi:PorV/PorQ family protein [candidate division KSB1 bacterium]|nr:PorV/PorQ family protein [candidate division KSB1 bacterium]
MKIKPVIYSLLVALFIAGSQDALAIKKKVATSGMTYLGISMGARESAMGDAATAITKGINGLWHNPSAIADIERFAFTFNQITWLVDTKLYGTAFAYSLGDWGTIGIDLTYMDYGEIIGTRPVPKSVDIREFVITGDIAVEDYAIGLSYARRISDRFAIGFKVKRLHESLGTARFVYRDPGEVRPVPDEFYKEQEWKLNDWGLDLGTVYKIGWKDLTFAMTMQNFSRDMKYWYEEFQTPMCLRMGMAMDVSEFFMPDNENLAANLSIDALHPNDYTERIHLGTELVCMQQFALRGGYKFNHDVETYTLGLGLNFDVAGVSAILDYAFTSAEYFKDIHRFSFQFAF